MLAKKSLLTRVWMATGKKVYYWITRDMLRFTDREGGGLRLVHDAPRITARLKAHPQVRETVVVAFPDRRAGTGLYAFVEGGPGLTEWACASSSRPRRRPKQIPKPPEHLQVIDELPRRASGEVRSEILQLVAMNQVDLIETLIADEHERTLVARIVADRRNLRDRTRVLISQISAPAAGPRARSAIAAASARSRPARTDRSRAAPCARASAPQAPPAADAGRTAGGADAIRLRAAAKMAAGMEPQFGQRRAQLRRRLPAYDRLPAGADGAPGSRAARRAGRARRGPGMPLSSPAIA